MSLVFGMLGLIPRSLRHWDKWSHEREYLSVSAIEIWIINEGTSKWDDTNTHSVIARWKLCNCACTVGGGHSFVSGHSSETMVLTESKSESPWVHVGFRGIPGPPSFWSVFCFIGGAMIKCKCVEVIMKPTKLLVVQGRRNRSRRYRGRVTNVGSKTYESH